MSKNKIKIGLALGSGGSRGFAHIGVLQELQKAGIEIDLISGSSIGSLVAAYFALYGQVDDLAAKMIDVSQMNFWKFLDLRFRGGLLNQNKIANSLNDIIEDKEFKETIIPLNIVSTDLNSGQEYHFNKGSILSAIQASCSIPFIFEPVTKKQYQLADGALANPVPVNVLKQMGADIIIAVNLYHQDEFNGTHLNAASALFRSSRILLHHLAKEKCRLADITIDVNTSDLVIAAGMKYLFSREDSLEAVNAGAQETQKNIGHIKKIIYKYHDSKA